MCGRFLHLSCPGAAEGGEHITRHIKIKLGAHEFLKNNLRTGAVFKNAHPAYTVTVFIHIIVKVKFYALRLLLHCYKEMPTLSVIAYRHGKCKGFGLFVIYHKSIKNKITGGGTVIKNNVHKGVSEISFAV